MMFVVLAENDMSAAHVETRKVLAQAHIDFLRAHAAHIPSAGPLRETPGAESIGGLWLVKAGSKAEVEELYRLDPFYPTRKACKILHWSRAYAEMASL